MSYARKNLKNVIGSLVLVAGLAVISMWQFHRYANFQDAAGRAIEGGTSHLVWSIVFAAIACGIGFLVFSVFLRHDTDDELHITSPPRRRKLA
jgi:high-affinity Fe2+/Pb2+ permease